MLNGVLRYRCCNQEIFLNDLPFLLVELTHHECVIVRSHGNMARRIYLLVRVHATGDIATEIMRAMPGIYWSNALETFRQRAQDL